MQVFEVPVEEYSRVISNPYHIYGSGIFNNLNKDKTDSLHYLLFKNTKYRLGIVGAFVDKRFVSPFSAPHGGFMFTSSKIKLEFIDDAIKSLIEWVAEKGGKSIKIGLPPSIYDESFISKQTNAFFRHQFTIDHLDLNYAFNTSDFNENYIQNMFHNARKALKIANKNNLIFKHCEDQTSRRLAFDVIRENRVSRGFPLRMTWEQLNNSANTLKSDFFLVLNSDNEAVSSAVVFFLSAEVVQVIYWGDRPGFTHIKPMNFITYKIFEYYSDKVKWLDIGISTDQTTPNFGLCDFKESIGCKVQTKLILIREM